MIRKAVLCLFLLLPIASYAQHKGAFQDVSIRNGQVTLSGTLIVPASARPVPAVILISGSGPHDRDETIAGKKIFLVIAEYLTRRGIAVLRYDDRGCFRSTGTYKTAVLRDFASDAVAAIDFLRKEPAIDPDKIGILGHSEGAMIGQIAAAKKKAAFFVSLAGPAQDGITMAREQRMLMSPGLTAEQRKALNVLMDSANHIVLTAADTGALRKQLHAFFGSRYDRSGLALKAMRREDFIKNYMGRLTAPNYKALLQHDPAEYFPRIHCPVLAVNGGKDVHVACAPNLRAWKEGLAAAGNRSVTVKAFPGLNHLFQQCKSCTISEYGQLPETISTEVLAYIQAWIAVQTGLKKS